MAERFGIGREAQGENESDFARGFVRIPRLVDRGLHLNENRVDPLFGVGRRETGTRRDRARDKGAIVAAQGAIGRVRDQNARDFLTRRIRRRAFASQGAIVDPQQIIDAITDRIRDGRDAVSIRRSTQAAGFSAIS